MRIRRWTTAGLVAVATLTLGAAGCASKTPSTSEASPTPIVLEPKIVLGKAAFELARTPFKMSGKNSSGSVQAAIDPVAKSMTSTQKLGSAGEEVVIDIIVVSGDPYVKAQLGDLAQILGLTAIENKWLHVDRTKLNDPKQFGVDAADLADVKMLFDALVKAEKSSTPNTYKGTIDLTLAKKAGLADEDVVTGLGDAAKAVPFEAVLDDKGRLTSLKLAVPATSKLAAQTWEVTFSDYGTPVTATKPAGAIETPDNVYAVFNQ